jgi:hypothetical protein
MHIAGWVLGHPSISCKNRWAHSAKYVKIFHKCKIWVFDLNFLQPGANVLNSPAVNYRSNFHPTFSRVKIIYSHSSGGFVKHPSHT